MANLGSTQTQKKSEQLKKKQLSPHDDNESFQQVRINWHPQKQISGYLKKIEESVEKCCKCNDGQNQKRKISKHRTNKKKNHASLWKLSQQDFPDMYSTTKDQISKVATECMIF